jgi:hypothetical protein
VTIAPIAAYSASGTRTAVTRPWASPIRARRSSCAPAQHLAALARVRQRRDVDPQPDAVGDLRAQVALLGVHRADEQEAGRMLDRDPFALDDVEPHRRRVEQDVAEMVVEQVDLVDVEDPAVGLGQQPRRQRQDALVQRAGHVQRAGDAVLGRVERQRDQRPAAAQRGQRRAAGGASDADRALGRSRIAPERAARDHLDLAQQLEQAAHRGRLRGPGRAAHQQPADGRIHRVDQERALQALLADDGGERETLH